MGNLFNAALAEKLAKQSDEIKALEDRVEELEEELRDMRRQMVFANGNNH